MRCFIDTRGGGAVKTVAFIVVDTAAGAELVCTNGLKAFRATAASGRHVFAVPELGTWSITASFGGKDKDGSVAITEYGQTLGLTLLFGATIFDPAGSESVTGTWLNSTYGTLSPTVTVTDRLSVKYEAKSGQQGTIVYAENMLDVTDLQSLEFEIAGVNQHYASYPIEWEVGIILRIPTGIDLINPLTPVTFDRSFKPTAGGSYSLDVSALSGLYYIGYYTTFVGEGTEYWTKGGTITTTKIIGK